MADLEKCGTRWTVRVPAVDGAVVEYDRAVDLWPHVLVEMDEGMARSWLRSIVQSAAGKALLAGEEV